MEEFEKLIAAYKSLHLAEIHLNKVVLRLEDYQKKMQELSDSLDSTIR